MKELIAQIEADTKGVANETIAEIEVVHLRQLLTYIKELEQNPYLKGN